MSLKYNYVPNVSQLIPVLGDSCDKDKGCPSIANSTCNSTCVCMPGFVADSTKEKCLPGTLQIIECVYHSVRLHVIYKQTSRNFAHFPEI
jgi:hypothetical protein